MTVKEKINDRTDLRNIYLKALERRLRIVAATALATADNLNSLDPDTVRFALDIERELSNLERVNTELEVLSELDS